MLYALGQPAWVSLRDSFLGLSEHLGQIRYAVVAQSRRLQPEELVALLDAIKKYVRGKRTLGVLFER